MVSLEDTLRSIVGAEQVRCGEPMSARTTFRVGGPADFFVMPNTADHVAAVLAACRERGERTYIMGRGSNVLVADEGLRGVVVQLAGNLADAEIGQGGIVRVQAGASNARVAAMACRAGLAGYEFAAGIPGTVGGAAIMNAGAYDGEFKQVAQSVTCLTRDLAIVDVSAEEAQWSYRHSMMADASMIVLSAVLRLHEGNPEDIQQRMDELARKRSSKQPLDLPSAGSTFKRPEGHFAGKLIQDAGLSGYTVGGAQVSTKHAGFVVNAGGASAADVLQVIRDVRSRVLDSSGVALEPEVRFWGFSPEQLGELCREDAPATR
ncbi:MAG TPA: UDP-N-acetylenolpyruvoylglucosamine reductase [Eggerthellaceae bacterium]|nr:UDP-N-acetylenolpyruvoylglucosamine reductase [Eggerthellaceae bacterium]